MRPVPPPSNPESTTEPLVSVLIPVHNAGPHLRPAIASVLRQTFRNLQIVCIDDGSTDGSGEILASLAAEDGRIQVVHTPNSGIVPTLNRAIGIAEGDFIARMDADDLCLPGRISAQVDFLIRNPGCGLVGSQVLVVDDENRPIKRTRFPLNHGRIEENLLNGMCPLTHPAVMMRRGAISEAGGYRDCVAEDYDLFLRMSAFTRIANLSEPLLLYRSSLSGLKQQKLAENHRSVLRSLAEALSARGLPADSLDHAEKSLTGYEERMRDPHAFLRTQLLTAHLNANLGTVRHIGRILREKKAHTGKTLRRWIKSELAPPFFRGNRDQPLVNRATGAT